MTNESDRELLELAAKAGGIPISEWVQRDDDDVWLGVRADSEERIIYWSSLYNPADALRLLVKLKLYDLQSIIEAYVKEEIHFTHELNNDPLAATMRAITRAAAEVGRSMK